MKIDKIDHIFINSLIRSPVYQEIIINKLKNNQYLPRKRQWLVEYGISYFQYFQLWVETLTRSNKRQIITNSTLSYFYDENPNSLPDRKLFLEYHQPGEIFQGISYSNHFPQRLNNKSFVYLLRLGFLLLISWVFHSELGPYYIRITRTCFLIMELLKYQKESEIYLFRIYKIENIFLAAYLKQYDIFVHLIASTTPLTPYNQFIIGDSIKLCNPYQKDEFPYYRAFSSCPKYDFWSPEEIVPLSSYYSTAQKLENHNTIGLYTQGFWLRQREIKINQSIGKDLLKLEVELFESLEQCLKQNPALRLIIYPHPIERLYYRKTNQHIFGKLLENDRVSIDFSGNNSISSFNLAGVGVTTMSTIGFDRIFLGFKTVFYIGDSNYININIPSIYNSVFCQTKAKLQVKLMDINSMTHAEYMKKFFGGEFWKPTASVNY